MTLVLALLGTMLLAALGSALVLETIVEVQIASAHGRAVEVLHAADGASERAMQDLSAVDDWSDLLNGSITSSFTDGAASGPRALPAGGTLDLTALTNTVRCGQTQACSSGALTASTAERPWGANNPYWQLFAYGPLEALLTDGSVSSLVYVVVWVGDDPAEHDDNPLVDGDPNLDGTPNDGLGVVMLLAHAYGPSGSRRGVEVTVARAVSGGVRVVAWREVPQ